jgi:CHASE3 domain sensor protein
MAAAMTLLLLLLLLMTMMMVMLYTITRCNSNLDGSTYESGVCVSDS